MLTSSSDPFKECPKTSPKIKPKRANPPPTASYKKKWQKHKKWRSNSRQLAKAYKFPQEKGRA
jgi:hypothetical protein